MQQQKCKQKQFLFEKVTISSNFESGNIQSVSMINENQFNLWIGSDHHANYKTWFYFSIEGINQGATVSFNIMNMNNQVKLYKEGLLPVFKTYNNPQWTRIKISIPPNGITKVQQGFQVNFRHTFTQNCKHYFAFTYPWTNQENNTLIQQLLAKRSDKLFCKYQSLGNSFKSRQINLITLTQPNEEQCKFQNIKIGNNQIYAFPNKKGVFISARVHPGETASSHMMNGIIKCLFSKQQIAECALNNCVFYIIPIINPDGVAQGNFRTDTQGKNLNRYYSNPSLELEPEIYLIKQFLISMIKNKKIHFCLDLHAHVNKQGAFIYGNSTSNLQAQMKVCLFPKILSFNSEFFDYESCNFSEKNMSSKDKGDELSKQGASRVAIFKDTGMAECWTLQCNYNSAKIINKLNQLSFANKNNNVSNAILTGKVDPQCYEQIKYLNIPQFQSIGRSIVETICDYYQLKSTSRIFSSKIKNMECWKINTAISCLRLLPFRFDIGCRKILQYINGGVNTKQNIAKINEMLGIKYANNNLNNHKKEIKSQNIYVHPQNNKRSQSISKEQKNINRFNSMKKIDKEKEKDKQSNIAKVLKTEKYINNIIEIPRPNAKKAVGKIN